MQSHTETLVEVDTKYGLLVIEEVTVETSDGDTFAKFCNIIVDGDIKHPKLSYKGAIRALGHFISGL